MVAGRSARRASRGHAPLHSMRDLGPFSYVAPTATPTTAMAAEQMKGSTGRFRRGPRGLGRIEAALLRSCGGGGAAATGFPGNGGGDTLFGAALLCTDLSGTDSHFAAAGANVERSTIFRIASQTKAVTSACALMLVEEGLLHLSQPVADLLPELSSLTVATPAPGGGVIEEPIPANAMTVRHLMNHTCGFAYVRPAPASAGGLAIGASPRRRVPSTRRCCTVGQVPTSPRLPRASRGAGVAPPSQTHGGSAP